MSVNLEALALAKRYTNETVAKSLTGAGAIQGATYTPFINIEGNLSWTNDKDLPNPKTINIKGVDGKEVQLRTYEGYIQWKLDTDTNWNNLMSLAELKGKDGDTVNLIDDISISTDKVYSSKKIDTDYIKKTALGINDGVATLDQNGKLETSQLPNGIDGIIEGKMNTEKTQFTPTGESIPISPLANKIYVDIDTNTSYRWGGTIYVSLSSGIALGITSATAYRGDLGKIAYEHSQLKTSNPHGINKSDIGLNNVSNDKQVKGLSAGTTENNVVVFGSDGYTIKDSGFVLEKSVPSDAIFSYNKATIIKDGLMSKEDKAKLDADVILPIATANVLGGVKIGKGINIAEDGTISVNSTGGGETGGETGTYTTMGVKIDLANSNPETCITYTDDAVGKTGGSSDWDSLCPFNKIKPCVLKDGVVQYYLNPDDFTKKADGSVADITSGNDGDVMIEIPKMAYMIYTEGNDLYVKITDNPNAKTIDERYCFNAHSRDVEGDREKLYISAYLGHNLSSKLRSLSGKVPTADQTIGTFRTQAQANGLGYDIVSFYPLTLLQCLYLIRFKNLDSQTALGRGYADGNSESVNTGGTNTKGMYFGETTGKQQMKFLGIEDFWGNLRWWIDGLYSDANYHILTAFKTFNGTGAGYVDNGQGATANIRRYMSKPQGTSQTGFITKEASGSETTYFCDCAYLAASCLPHFGGNWDYASDAGAFFLDVTDSTSYSNAGLGGRLMYL